MKSTGLRVLHVIPSLDPQDGGTTFAHYTIEKCLSEVGVSMTTISTVARELSFPPTSPLDGSSTKIATPPERIYFKRWVARYKIAPCLAVWLLRNVRDFDIVHVHGMFSFASTIGAATARFLKVPYIVQPHGMLNSYGLTKRRRFLKSVSRRLVDRSNLLGAAGVVFTSDSEAVETLRVIKGLRSFIVPLGVEPTPGRSLSKPGIHLNVSGKRVILFIGRIDPKKNIEALIDAVASSTTLRSGWKVLVAGDIASQYGESLRRRVFELALGETFVWLGHVEGEVKEAVFAAADIFVLPSFSENFGLAAAEALLAGVPCILSPGVAIAEEVATGGAGLVVSPTAAALVDALERLDADWSAVGVMGARARKLGSERFSVYAMRQGLLDIYSAILPTQGPS